MNTNTIYDEHHEESEKEASLHHEHAASVEEEGLRQGFDAAETARVLHKIDYRLLPVLSWLYLLAFLDRSNLGNARIAGLEEDLELSGGEFNLAATVSWKSNRVLTLDLGLTVSKVFFLTYCLLEIPANIMLKILRPSRWLAFLVFAWGTVSLVDIVGCSC